MSEASIRLGIFLGIFFAFALLELFLPHSDIKPERRSRWLANLGLSALSAFSLRFILPVAAVTTAFWANESQIGLSHWLGFSPVLAGVISFILLDFSVWFAHLASHKVQLLWQLHKVHHTDPLVDVTTAVRFHPFEIMISMLWKCLIVMLLGAPVAAVIVFEAVLNGAALFNHANIKLPKKLDNALRYVLVTPDMHRIHHSVRPRETDSNYGFNFPFWDYLFRTYVDEPKDGQDKMKMGLNQYPGDNPKKLHWVLWLPIKSYLGFERSKRKSKENIAGKAQ